MVWWLQLIVYVVGGVSALALVIALFRTGRPVRSLLGNALQGACALAAVDVTGALTGVSLGINWVTAVACAALGVPGVITLLLLKLIFGI